MAKEIELHVERDGYEIIARGDENMFGIWTRYLNPYSQQEYRGSGTYRHGNERETWRMEFRWFSGSPLVGHDQAALEHAVKGHFDAQEAPAVASPPTPIVPDSVAAEMAIFSGRDLNVIIPRVVDAAYGLPARLYSDTPRDRVRARLVSIAAAALAGIHTIDAERR